MPGASEGVAQSLPLGHLTGLNVPNGMTAILQVHKTQPLSGCHQTMSRCYYPVLILCLFRRHNFLNPAIVSQDPDQIDSHDCTIGIKGDTKLGTGLSDVPVQNGDLVFAGGSCI